MLKEKRFEYILKQLTSKEIVTYAEIATHLDVSEDTIRRDIESLHKNGLLSKVRGGAIPRAKNPLSFQERTNFLTEEKEVIALKVRQFLKKGMTVFMDGGTTNCVIANGFPLEIKFRVVTNNLMLIPILMKFKNIDLIVLGGNSNLETATTTGIETCRQVNEYVADLYFMGTCAVDPNFGVTAAVETDGEVKKAMLATSKKTVALSNHSLLGTTEPFRVCALEEVGVLATNLPANSKDLEDFRNLGIQIV